MLAAIALPTTLKLEIPRSFTDNPVQKYRPVLQGGCMELKVYENFQHLLACAFQAGSCSLTVLTERLDPC